MALAYHVARHSDLPKMFAAHDEFSSIVNELFGRILTPDDDYYTAPFCFLPEGDTGGWVVMTCRVPWLHFRFRGNNRDRRFERARYIMMERGSDREECPWPEMGVERLQDNLALDEEEVFTFTHDGCYPDGEDISRDLEDKAVEVVCEAMGWPMPRDWRGDRERERLSRDVGETFDLAKWDARKRRTANKRLKCANGCAATISRETDDGDSAHCDARHKSHNQQRDSSPGSLSSLASHEGRGHEGGGELQRDHLHREGGWHDEGDTSDEGSDHEGGVEGQGPLPPLNQVVYEGDEGSEYVAPLDPSNVADEPVEYPSFEETYMSYIIEDGDGGHLEYGSDVNDAERGEGARRYIHI